MANESKKQPKLEEARRRWGTAEILSGNPTTNPQPAPEAPAAAQETKRAA
jgi:hypothetical protein